MGEEILEHAWLSVIPFLIVIPMSIWLKDILPGLVVGLLVGSFIVTSNLLEAAHNNPFLTWSPHCPMKQISKSSCFLYLFGGLVGMMNIAGGIKGFSEWIGREN